GKTRFRWLRPSGSGRARQFEVEGRPLAGIRFHPDRAAHPLHELATDVEPEPGPGPYLRAFEAVELLEDRPLLRDRDADPVVPDFDAHTVRERGRRDGDRAAVRRVFDGVVDQVHEHLLDPVAVAERGGAVRLR